MTRDEIRDFICNTVGQPDATSKTRCEEFIQFAYSVVWDAELWRDTLRVQTAAVTTTGLVAIPAGIERIVAIKSGSTNPALMTPVDLPFLLQLDPNALTNTGDPLAFYDYTDADDSETKKVQVYPLPTANQTVTVIGKRPCPILGGSDSSLIRNTMNCIQTYAHGYMLQRQRQYAKADKKFEEAGALLEEARAIENKQGAKQPMVVPDVEPTHDWEASDWIVAK